VYTMLDRYMRGGYSPRKRVVFADARARRCHGDRPGCLGRRH
jgi:hypothetical protein